MVGPIEVPELDPDIEYWLFLSTPITDGVSENLDGQGYKAELVVDTGYIGTGNVWIYRVIDKEKDEE